MANPTGTINADEDHTGRAIIKSNPTAAQDAATKAYADSIAGGGVNAFGTIAVSGQSSVVADAAPDTLTLVAGTNVTLTTNASTDTVTIAASGGGGSGTVTTTGTPATGNLSKFSGATSITNGDLTGDVTTSGGVATAIANNAVSLAKMATMATDSILGRATATTGNVEVLSTLPFAFTGDVTRPADSNATTIAANAVTYAKMQAVSATSKLLGSSATTTPVQEIALGTNLSMSGTTLNSTAGSTNAFGTIAVSGQSDVVADAAPDTLTLVAGSNVTLTTDAATDTITIAASGGGGGGTTSQVSGSNFTSSSASLVDVTGLTFAAAASHFYEVDVLLRFQNSGTNAIQFALAYSAAGATGTAFFYGNQSATASGGTANMSVLGTAAGPSFGLVATTDFMLWIKGIVITGANAGNITVKTLHQTSGTTTIYIGSRMTVTQLA